MFSSPSARAWSLTTSMAVLAPGMAWGGDEPAAAPAHPGSPLAVAAALVPGVLVHGAGHFVLGERDDARRLLVAEAVGLGGVVTSLGVMGLSGAAGQLAPLYVLPAVGGLALFALSWLGDVVVAGRGTEPWLEASARPDGLTLRGGWAGVLASRTSFGQALTVDATLRRGGLLLEPWGVVEARGSYQGGGARLGLGLTGRGDGRELALVLALAHQRFATDGFALSTAALYADGRLDGAWLARTLRGTWLVARLGVAAEGMAYDGRSRWPDALRPLLVAAAGMGLRASERVELELTYRQEKDELPGGMVLNRGLEGFLGAVELRGRVRAGEGWAVVPTLRYGAGLWAALAVETRAW